MLATAGKATSQANISTKKLLSDFPSHATTPINVDLLEYELCNLPDKNVVSYLCTGLRYGFDALVQSKKIQTKECKNNLSARV